MHLLRGYQQRMGLQNQLKNHPLVILAGMMVAAGALMWTASETMRVQPREREVARLQQYVATLQHDLERNAAHAADHQHTQQQELARLQQQVAALQHDLRELNAAYAANQQYSQRVLTDKRQLEHTLAASNESLKQWNDRLEGWKMQNAALQKAVNLYTKNCSILAEVRSLESRKTQIDANLSRKQYDQQEYDTWKLNQTNCKRVSLISSTF